MNAYSNNSYSAVETATAAGAESARRGIGRPRRLCQLRSVRPFQRQIRSMHSGDCSATHTPIFHFAFLSALANTASKKEKLQSGNEAMRQGAKQISDATFRCCPRPSARVPECPPARQRHCVFRSTSLRLCSQFRRRLLSSPSVPSALHPSTPPPSTFHPPPSTLQPTAFCLLPTTFCLRSISSASKQANKLSQLHKLHKLNHRPRLIAVVPKQ